MCTDLGASVQTTDDSLSGMTTIAEQSVDPHWDNRVAARIMLRAPT